MTDARSLTLDLGGRWYRSYGTAACPICQSECRKGQNALTLHDGRNGRLLLHCKKSGCAFVDILAAAGLRAGDYTPPDAETLARRDAEQRAQAEKRARQAEGLWRETQPAAGTVVETYLRGRGITCPLPQTLRLHPSCWHPTAKRFPAMVGLVEGGEGFATHRTYLAPEGDGKAKVEPAKAMLGAVSGGAVRLASEDGPLMVAEGIETALSLLSGLVGGPATVWAALSTSGMVGLHLPPAPGKLTIAPDGDRAGRGAALTLADRAARDGWVVSILTPPPGGDFNDLLRGEV